MAGYSRPLLLVSCYAASHTRVDERFWIPFKTFAADGGARPNSGGTPFRQPCPAYPFAMGERHRRNVSARKLSEPGLHSETHFSKAQPRLFARNRKKLAAHNKPGCPRGTKLL